MRSLVTILSILIMTVSISAQDLDKILEAHYKAAGLDDLEKIGTIITSGENVYTMAGIESSFIMYQVRPNKIRVQGTFQGSSVIQTFNGEKGWIYAPTMGIPEPKEMKGEELESILHQSNFENPLWNYKEKGNTLELLGSSVDGSAHHLKFNSNGDELNFFIDKESHLLSSIKSIQIMGGAETGIEILLSDYKVVKGIPMARKVVTKMNGEVVTTIEIEKVEYNKKLDPSLFEKPGIE